MSSFDTAVSFLSGVITMATVKSKTAPRAASPGTQASPATPITPEQRYQMIAEAAYFRAQSQGFCGDPAQDWVAAEAEIDRVLLHSGQAGQAELSPKQIFQQKLETQLQELDTILENLKLQASLGKAELRTEFEKQLELLGQKRSAAQVKLNELSRRTEGAWEDLKGGAEKTWEDMRQTMNQIAERFR